MYQRDDFKQLFYLNKEIARLRLEIEDIRTRRGERCTQRYEDMDMPRGTGVSDKVGESAADIVEVDEVIRGILQRREEEKARLMELIQTIPDSETRNIFLYRYYYGYSWRKVAKLMNNTEEAVKNKDYRFFKEYKK